MTDSPHARPDPLYRRIANELGEGIRSRRIAAGDLLPTEHELCRIYGVSRITVRKALDVLVEGHYVLRRRGVGTFVRQNEPDRWSVRLNAPLDAVSPPNRLVLVRQATCRPPADVLSFAGLPKDARMRVYEGTNHVANGSPLEHVQYYFPLPLADRVIGSAIEGPHAPFRIVERLLDVRIDHAVQLLAPAVADGRTARHLKLSRGTPVLRAIRKFVDTAGRLVYLADGLCHPDRFRIVARLDARPATS